MQSNFRAFEELVSLGCGFRNQESDSGFWFSVPSFGFRVLWLPIRCVTVSLIPRYLFVFSRYKSIFENAFLPKNFGSQFQFPGSQSSIKQRGTTQWECAETWFQWFFSVFPPYKSSFEINFTPKRCKFILLTPVIINQEIPFYFIYYRLILSGCF